MIIKCLNFVSVNGTIICGSLICERLMICEKGFM